MPSPPIPRSISAPDISVKEILPSDKSSRSSKSAKGTAWSRRAGNFITRKKKSELTEESLEEFNRKNAVLEEKKYSTSSPYYKGLTDFTLDINKEKLPAVVSCPVIDGNDTASVASSYRSSFVVTMQQLGTFCMFFRPKEEKEGSPSTSLSSRTQKDIDLEKNGKEVKSSSTESNTTTHLLNKEKPLRERFLSQDYAPPPPPPPQQISPPRYLPPTQTSPPAEPSGTKKVTLNTEEIKDSEEETVLFTWADKYRPNALTDFICNRETAVELQAAAKSGDCPHFIFEGRPGVGKRTMVSALLREIFGADKVQAREESKEFYLKGEAVTSIHVNMKLSSQHVEVNLSELKGYEKHVIVELIKEKSNKLSNNALRSNHDNCRAIILYEADKLSADALLYIRWLLERYKGNNKVFFCCNDVSKLQSIKSLCRVVNLLPPSNEEIVEVLEFIAKLEGIDLPHELAENIANNSKNNLRQAIRSFEATWRYNNCNSQLKEDQEIMTGWEEGIAKVAEDIIKEQSPKQLFNIRRELQKLIEHTVSPVFIFKTLVAELKKHLSESSQIIVDNLYKDYNRDDDSDEHFAFTRNRTEEMSKRHNDPAKKNVHDFMRIEEFVAKFMSSYKGLATNNKLHNTKMKAKLEDILISPKVHDMKMKGKLDDDILIQPFSTGKSNVDIAATEKLV